LVDPVTTPTAPNAASGERRQVTALFADMVGFTAISERLGEEGTFGLVRPIYELLEAAVREQGGSVKDFTGDGMCGLVAQDGRSTNASRPRRPRSKPNMACGPRCALAFIPGLRW
jgi:class 3 adenylate cyclase